MSEPRPCPYCGGEMHVRMYDEDFYRAVLGTEYEYEPEYEIEHVDRLAAALAKCPYEMECYKSEADAIAAWNTRADDDADLIPEVVRRLEEFERTGGETVSLEEIMAEDGWVRERTCKNLAQPEDADDLPFCCSECGARSSYGDGTFHIGESFMLNGNLMLADAWHAWRHCPNCGAKVVNE